MWDNQNNNEGERFKLVVYYYPEQPRSQQTFKSFLGEEKKGTAIAGLTARILLKHSFGRYKMAIFYDNGNPIEKWIDGIKQ
jgi:hypothetical protein